MTGHEVERSVLNITHAVQRLASDPSRTRNTGRRATLFRGQLVNAVEWRNRPIREHLLAE
jgi:hypothetical protein